MEGGRRDSSAGAGLSASSTGFPRTAGALLARLGRLYGLDVELGTVRTALEEARAAPIEASVSLRARAAASDVRATFRIAPRSDDPDGRASLRAALVALGAERMSAEVDDVLASVASSTRPRRLGRGIALRARTEEAVRIRPGGWVGGETSRERAERIATAMRRLRLEEAARLHDRLAAQLGSNPFAAVVPYAFGVDLGPDRALGAKTYFACEWTDIAVELLSDRIAEEVGLGRSGAFALLAETARAESRGARWLLDVSFELPADPGRGFRAKAYLPAKHLAANECEGHAAAIALARRLDLDVRPYERLLSAVRPDGLSAERPCSLMLGLSATHAELSLEIYLFDPAWRSHRDTAA